MTSHKPYTEETKQTIVAFAGKKTASEIATITGRSTAGVYQYARRHGIDLKQRGENHYNAKLKDLQVQMIWALHAAGFTGAEIHQQLFSDLGRATIYDIIGSSTHRHNSVI